MTFQVTVQPEAEREWKEAVHWYEERAPGVGFRFNSAIHDHLQILAQRPDRFRLVSRLTRKVQVKGWPYFIFFVINESHRQVQIVSVWHCRRNPETLSPRLQ